MHPCIDDPHFSLLKDGDLSRPRAGARLPPPQLNPSGPATLRAHDLGRCALAGTRAGAPAVFAGGGACIQRSPSKTTARVHEGGNGARRMHGFRQGRPSSAAPMGVSGASERRKRAFAALRFHQRALERLHSTERLECSSASTRRFAGLHRRACPQACIVTPVQDAATNRTVGRRVRGAGCRSRSPSRARCGVGSGRRRAGSGTSGDRIRHPCRTRPGSPRTCPARDRCAGRRRRC